MKKNLLSVLILALLIVNLALTSVMMFGMMGSMKSTNALVSKIAGVLNLELSKEGEEKEQNISISDSVSFDIADSMTIPLKISTDGEAHYAKVAVSIQMNKGHKDYKKQSETIEANVSMIKAEIISVVSSKTLEEFLGDSEGVCEEILKRLQELYESDFIYKVVFSDLQAY